VGAWGTGIFENDDAADLRDRWRALFGAGFDPRQIGRRLIDELDLSEDPAQTAMWLGLADLLWRSGRLAPDIKRRALSLVRGGAATEGWEKETLPARQRVLDRLVRRLRSPMPPPVRSRPRHPCDWRRGELLSWRTADGGAAVLRVADVDKGYGAGGSPVVELVGASGPDAPSQPRALTERWQGTHFKIGVFEPGTYPAPRIRRIVPPSPKRRGRPAKVPPIGTRWDGLDDFLLRAFDLPWPRGTILRIPTAPRPTWIVVVDVSTVSGLPATVCEVLAWQGTETPSPAALREIDVHRTADTVSIVRARVVDARNRKSIAEMKRHLGVRSVDERVPFRVTLVGFAPKGVTTVGRRRVSAPESGTNVADWADLGGLVGRL
jgi:hypothetical protein